MSQYHHREAFCLMLYRDSAGNEEWIWNSRDGVTPYGITSRQGLDAVHVEWNRDRCLPGHRPRRGDRVFVDLTIERAREHRRAFVDHWWYRPGFGTQLCERYASKQAAIDDLAQADMEFGGGRTPDLIEITEDA